MLLFNDEAILNTDKKINRSLVIGGSGMLAGTSLWLAELSKEVYVSGRNILKLQKLVDKKRNIIPLIIDNKDQRNFKESLDKIKGRIDLVVAWIHSDAKDSLDVLIRDLAYRRGETKLYVINGIANGNQTVSPNENISYNIIRLGFIMENENSRWLTDEEISNGVISAIRSGKSDYTVGETGPVEKIPQ
jgi:hypothetical protein